MFNFLNHLKLKGGFRHKKIIFDQHSLCTNAATVTAGANFKSPSHQTIHLFLEKCSTMAEAKQLHGQIILHGLTTEILTMGKLISFCSVSDAGNLHYAQLLFDKIPEPNRFMYNSLIRGYSNSNDPSKCLSFYRRMVSSGLSPNEFTLPFVLKACASSASSAAGCLDGVIVHGQGIKLGYGSQIFVQNALINVYVVGGLIQCARKVFDDIIDRTLVSWNSMIGGYSKTGHCKEAVLIFQEMRHQEIEPDKFTFVSLLSVASQSNDLELGRFIHLYIESTGAKIDIYVQNALVDMYGKCGDLHMAKSIFDRLPNKNDISWTSMVSAYATHGLVECARNFFDQIPMKSVASWNALISCYIQEGHYKEALSLFGEMWGSDMVPDEITLTSVLSACCQLGDLVTGKKIHEYIRDIIKPSVTITNGLIDMYAKCGDLRAALNIFLEMPDKSTVSWNVMIRNLALHGYGFKAIEVFESMQSGGVRPDGFTFTGLLSACSHSGLVDAGQYFFERMIVIYGVRPEIEHYACMVDLLGRGGLLKEAVALVGGMPMKPDVVVWGALLGACRTCSNMDVPKIILKQLLELEPYNAGLYVLFSNIYCEAGRWEDVQKVWKLMKDHGIEKGSAVSSLEINGRIHEFRVNDKINDNSSGIYVILEQLTDHLKSIHNLPKAFWNTDEIW